MAHESEIAFLKQCVADLERRFALWNKGAMTAANGQPTPEIRELDER